MSTSVVSGGFEISSNHESGSEMLEALAPKDDAPGPRITVEKGEAVKPEDGEASKAAATLGKRGGEATAKARAEAKPAKEAEAKPVVDGEKVSDPASDEAEKDKKAGNPRHDPTARVTEATREARAAREEATREREERLKVSEELARLRYEREQAAKPAAPQADPGKPRREHFESDEQYLDARDAYNRNQWTRESEQRRQVEEREGIIASHKDGFRAKIDEAKAADPSFLEKTLPIAQQLEATFNIPPHEQTAHNWMGDYLLQYPADAPALLLHFSENDDVFQRVASLRTPHAVYTEMAKTSARLEAAPTATSSRPEVSKAKPPVRPVTGSPHTADPDITGEIDFDTFMARQGRAASKR